MKLKKIFISLSVAAAVATGSVWSVASASAAGPTCTPDHDASVQHQFASTIYLLGSDCLKGGESLYSGDHIHTLTMTTGGSLNLYREVGHSSTLCWSSQSSGSPYSAGSIVHGVYDAGPKIEIQDSQTNIVRRYVKAAGGTWFLNMAPNGVLMTGNQPIQNANGTNKSTPC